MWTSWQDNNSLYWQVDVSNLSGCLWGYYHNLEKGNCLETPNVLLFNAEGVHEMRPHILKSHSVFFRLWSKILQTKILMNSSPNKTPCLKNTKPSHLIPLRSAFIALVPTLPALHLTGAGHFPVSNAASQEVFWSHMSCRRWQLFRVTPP